jgi:hypothetical protein
MSYLPGAGTLNSFEFQEVSAATRTLGSTGQTTVLNVTEGGILLWCVVEVVNSLSAGGYVGKLKFTVDGGTATSVTVVNGISFVDWMVAGPGLGDGTAAGDKRMIPLGFTYKTSIKVEADCTTAGGGIGSIKVTAGRAKKV